MRWHEIGSGGHTDCLTTAPTPASDPGTPPAPGPEALEIADEHEVIALGECYGDRESVAIKLNAALREANAAIGWQELSGPHPSGGYHSATVGMAHTSRVEVTYRGASGQPHRADGPAGRRWSPTTKTGSRAR